MVEQEKKERTLLRGCEGFPGDCSGIFKGVKKGNNKINSIRLCDLINFVNRRPKEVREA